MGRESTFANSRWTRTRSSRRAAGLGRCSPCLTSTLGVARFTGRHGSYPPLPDGGRHSSPASPPLATTAAASCTCMSRLRLKLARAILWFKCRQAVMKRSYARGHSAKPPAAVAQLVCRRRSLQQLGACADDPHTNRKILRRPFSTCRTCWSTPKITCSSSPCAGGCGL